MTADAGISQRLEPLVNQSELLLRQVHPDQLLADGALSSVAFRPSALDAGLLSTRRERIGAAQAYDDWVVEHESVGTWALSIEDVDKRSLHAYDDSMDDDQPDGHASVDFTMHSRGACEKKGRHLRDAAQERGPLHPLVGDPIEDPK
ncbi:hypothetical protein E3T46_17325 [Cryobacterium sp. Hh11]|uniref:hypothetical protein n=1 Tax=Cryobacterium sp. Hh11 TaxID=2555868 RepID=UPI00106CB460|nr:hypothetical protein [Cryobacterium sp. Hh11]TFD47557.1 hypothetical protein E3T46_17325 [Cryobacterium sp. Hh11]